VIENETGIEMLAKADEMKDRRRQDRGRGHTWKAKKGTAVGSFSEHENKRDETTQKRENVDRRSYAISIQR